MSAQETGLLFTVLTNVAIWPAFVYTIAHSASLYFECWFVFLVFCFSTAYHSCDYAGLAQCPMVADMQRLDHVTAEGVIPIAAIYLIPFTQQRYRHIAYFAALSMHFVIQLFQIATLEWQGAWAAVGILMYLRFHIDNKKLPIAFWLAVIGVTMFFLDEARVYGWAHSLFHIFTMLALFVLYVAVSEAQLFEIGQRWLSSSGLVSAKLASA
jgi:hypothetical protein